MPQRSYDKRDYFHHFFLGKKLYLRTSKTEVPFSVLKGQVFCKYGRIIIKVDVAFVDNFRGDKVEVVCENEFWIKISL